jgi:predicted lipoprotein|tara:strand:- start:2060 stop:3142 length:1083 start_codon:yes stop_codon:yes gene_type:complete
MIKKIFSFTFILIFLIFSCSSDNDDSSSEVWEQKSEMLTNWADNFIIPSHSTLLNNLVYLEGAGNSFTNLPNQQNLDSLRTVFINAYMSWQYVEMFDIGPAEESYYKSKMNIYPTTISRIEINIQNENTDFNNSNNYSAQGFPALDYLLYGIETSDELIISKYNTDSKYLSYLSEIINQMLQNTYPIVEEWESYRNSFISSVENTATSSVNKMTNDFIYYYEKGFRANKFGIPAGVFSGGALPEKVEAYYNKNISKALALESFQAIKNFYNGNGRVSLRQYISEVSTAEYSELSTDILDLFNIAENLINGLDDNFYNQILTNNVQVLEAYDAIQQGTILLKTDMLSVLQIPTDYVDADGD